MSDPDKSKAVRPSYRKIGRQLERIWDGVTKEPIPEEMMALLRQLDEQEAKRGPAPDKKDPGKQG